ncbi:MAG TPA: lysophospholipid acyltransferase family protein [Rubrobacteraceae bacterium]|nr:lysophospholipid acyltransferase family protein [Rubrobacteraceae bacterium]
MFGFVVHGVEKVPKEGPLIIASNHRRYADPVLVSMAVPRRIQWMAKRELFISPFDRLFFFIGAFPVDRQRGARAALKTSLDLLAANWALGIFPEGTRRKSYDPTDAPKTGIAMISVRSNAPILPVFVGEAPNPLRRLKNARLSVYIGDPIYMHNTNNANDDRRDRREVAGRILWEIYALGERFKRGEGS